MSLFCLPLLVKEWMNRLLAAGAPEQGESAARCGGNGGISMRFVDEFRDPALAGKLLARIREESWLRGRIPLKQLFADYGGVAAVMSTAILPGWINCCPIP